jgi:hypothetical protein
LDFGKASLFDPMGFQNEEWMHQDPSGFDNPSYGLRLRPIDMQKFGILFMNEGCWAGRQLLSRTWVSTSFTPWMRTRANLPEANYGWYWWQQRFESGWSGHSADGWKGQRITVFPDKGIVVTMTGIIEDVSEDKLYADLINRFIIPAVETGIRADTADVGTQANLKSALADVWMSKNAINSTAEARMIPSVSFKERHRSFR